MQETSLQADSNAISATILGCGKMGSAMLSLWLEKSVLSQATVIDPSILPEPFMENPKVTHQPTFDGNLIDTDILILAVKPQILDLATESLKNHISDKCLVLSIAAGKSLVSIEAIFGSKQPVIRVMPNTPAAIGQGASVAIANSNASDQQKLSANALLESLGTLHWIEDETLMNAVTALSGSGPAYIFYLIETLSKAGEEIGLAPEMASELARQTVIGSAALAKSEENTPASKLRENVTSPGGTTQAALNVLMDGNLQDIYINALKSAQKRGEELNN